MIPIVSFHSIITYCDQSSKETENENSDGALAQLHMAAGLRAK